MYIAIEGVKGVGKSTLFEKIIKHLEENNIQFVSACPTKPMAKYDFFDSLYLKVRFFEKIDLVKDFIYARRANYLAKTINWKSVLVIGDRSILTSYITRLWEHDDPEEHIAKIDKLQPHIPAPDYILYLKADINDVLQRISKRKSRKYGKEDEQPNKIITDSKAYDYLITQKSAKRLAKTKCIIIDASKSESEIYLQTIEIIQTLIKHENNGAKQN